jgi:hypothetical protein
MKVKFFNGRDEQVKKEVSAWLDKYDKDAAESGGKNGFKIHTVGQSQQNSHMIMSIFYTEK